MNAITNPETSPTVEVAPVTDRRIHNEANFNPEEYEVLEYLDNQPPRFYAPVHCPGMPMDVWRSEFEEARRHYDEAHRHWTATLDRYFPHRHDENSQVNIHKCTHCGNTQVRYIVAVKHRPTGQNVVFGDVCVERLSFANHDAFKAAQLRAKAAQGNANLQIYNRRVKFLAEHPDFAAMLANEEEMSHPSHANNAFAKDIIAKLNKYGELSPRQVEAFLGSLQRDREWAARRAQEAAARANEPAPGPVPSGRQIVEGELLSWKEQDGAFGLTWKMLVKLTNGSKIWSSIPSKFDLSTATRGMKLKMKVTIHPSKDDIHFGFGSRPTLLSAEAPAAPATA